MHFIISTKLSLFVIIASISLLVVTTSSIATPLPSSSCMSVRALMIHPRSIKQMDFLDRTINLAKENRFNTIIIEATGWINYPGLENIGSVNAFNPKDISKLIATSQGKSIEVIPTVALLTHQQEVIKRFQPELLLNDATTDINNPKAWIFEKKLLDDTIAMFHPSKILIGHDELWGYGHSIKIENQMLAGTKRTSPKDFAMHIIKVHDYLKQKGIQTIIWGDMFLTPDFSLGIYPSDGSQPSPGYNGTPEFVSLLSTLPKDIIIADWHYENKSNLYPSYDFFQKQGFLVWGASWHESHNIQSFSKYVHLRAHQGEGMIATTWHFSEEKYNDYLNRIIVESAQNFNQGCTQQ